MLKRKYYLVFVKNTGTGQLAKDKIALPMYHTRNGFKITHAGGHRSLFNFFQAWFWVLRFRWSSPELRQKYFAYKQANGNVFIQKLHHQDGKNS